MREKGNVMNEIMSPGTEASPFILEDFTISDDLDIPGSSKNNLSEERISKILHSPNGQLISANIVSMKPTYTQVVPYPEAEVAVEK